MRKGRVFADYFVSCGKCNDARPLATYKREETTKLAKEMGWKQKQPYGWICPSCQ